MTQFLPPNLLALFAPRDAIPYKQPVKALTWEKDRDRAPYTGISQYVNLFEDSKDTPPPTRGETKEEKKIRKIREKLEKRNEDIEEEVKTWDPHNDPNAGGDAFKTLFVSRINYDTTESKLRREFEMYGKIRKVTMVKDIATGKPRGYAFIEYERERDMHTAYKSGDGKKIDNRRVLVDVERGRTVKGWRPRRLGGGLGSTRAAPTDDAARRSDRERSERSERGERGERVERGGGDRERERERERSKGESDRHRDRESRDKRRRSPDKEKSEKDRDRTRDRDRDRDREKRRRDDRGDKDRRDRKRESDHKSSRRDVDKDGGDVGNDKKEERSRDKERESRRHRDRDRDRSDKDKDRRHRDRDRGKDREGRSEKEERSSNRNPIKEEYVANSDMKKEYQENYEGKYYGGQGDAYNNTDQNDQSNNGFYQAQDGDTDTGYQQENYSNSKQYANQGNYGYDAPMQQDDY